jgi:hypothetical protein
MPPPKRFHLVFSFIMGLLMISLMTFIVRAVFLRRTAEADF